MQRIHQHLVIAFSEWLAIVLFTAGCTVDFPDKEMADSSSADTASSTGMENTDSNTADSATATAIGDTSSVVDTATDTQTVLTGDTGTATADTATSDNTDSVVDTVTAVDTATEFNTATEIDTAADTTLASGCLLISEYIEYGAGNRAIELYNCDSTALKSDAFSLCLVQDSDTDCTAAYTFAKKNIPVSGVVTLCHPELDTGYYSGCDFVDGAVTAFDGNDRLVLKNNDVVIDEFGNPAVPPAFGEWANVTYRRTTLTLCSGNGGNTCAVTDYFSPASDTDTPFSNLGIPP